MIGTNWINGSRGIPRWLGRYVAFMEQWGMVVILAILMVCAGVVARLYGVAWGGCNTIPDAVCALMVDAPANCTVRIEAAQQEAAATGRAVELADLRVLVRPDGRVLERARGTRRAFAQVEPRYVDPCSVNPEACTPAWRQRTPQERFEAMGLPEPESRDIIYRWGDELRDVDEREAGRAARERAP